MDRCKKLLQSHLLFAAVLVFCLFSSTPSTLTAEDLTLSFPEIRRLGSPDVVFSQFSNEVDLNKGRVVRNRNSPEVIADFLTIYTYTPRPGEDFNFLAARTALPHSTLASINRLQGQSIEPGKPILLPNSPGIFLPANPASALEQLLAASRADLRNSIEITLNISGREQRFHFFPGSDFTQTERTFFLNPSFRFPLRSFRLTSAFGIRNDPFSGDLSMHYGIDLAAPMGTEVYSITDGIVAEIGYNHIYGNYILIEHRNGLSSFYAHLSTVETVLQARVNSSTMIGRVGSTGMSTGPHLHFELRQNGRPLDPAGRLQQPLQRR